MSLTDRPVDRWVGFIAAAVLEDAKRCRLGVDSKPGWTLKLGSSRRRMDALVGRGWA